MQMDNFEVAAVEVVLVPAMAYHQDVAQLLVDSQMDMAARQNNIGGSTKHTQSGQDLRDVLVGHVKGLTRISPTAQYLDHRSGRSLHASKHLHLL